MILTCNAYSHLFCLFHSSFFLLSRVYWYRTYFTGLISIPDDFKFVTPNIYDCNVLMQLFDSSPGTCNSTNLLETVKKEKTTSKKRKKSNSSSSSSKKKKK